MDFGVVESRTGDFRMSFTSFSWIFRAFFSACSLSAASLADLVLMIITPFAPLTP